MSQRKAPYRVPQTTAEREAYETAAEHTRARREATSQASVAIQALLEPLPLDTQRAILAIAGMVEGLTADERRMVLSGLAHRCDVRAVDEERKG